MGHCSTNQDKRQSKAFRERVAYWKKKGLSESDALTRASLRNYCPKNFGDTQKYHKKNNELKSYQSSSKHNSNLLLLPSKNSLESRIFQTQGAEVSASRKLDYCDQIYCPKEKSETWPEPNLQVDPDRISEPYTSIKSACRRVFCRIPEMLALLVSGLIIAGSSGLLIVSSAQVFGISFSGWVTASLLEVGILLLSVYRASSITGFIVSKLGAVTLAFFSLFVLHTGIYQGETQALAKVETTSEIHLSLKQDRERLLALQDQVPTDQLKRREALLHAIRAISEKLEKLQQTSSGVSLSVIKRNYQVESFQRLALMFLSTVFAHHFVGRFRQMSSGHGEDRTTNR